SRPARPHIVVSVDEDGLLKACIVGDRLGELAGLEDRVVVTPFREVTRDHEACVSPRRVRPHVIDDRGSQLSPGGRVVARGTRRELLDDRRGDDEPGEHTPKEVSSLYVEADPALGAVQVGDLDESKKLYVSHDPSPPSSTVSCPARASRRAAGEGDAALPAWRGSADRCRCCRRIIRSEEHTSELQS